MGRPTKGLASVALVLSLTSSAFAACPLNYDDSCGWMDVGDICFKSMWHGKTYEDALTTCAAMGTAECPSKLLKVENIPALVGADPEMRVHGSLFRVDAIRREGRWVDSMEMDIVFPEDWPITGSASDESTGVVSYVEEVLYGLTPMSQREAFLCESCVSADVTCPVICQYCIPRGICDDQASIPLCDSGECNVFTEGTLMGTGQSAIAYSVYCSGPCSQFSIDLEVTEGELDFRLLNMDGSVICDSVCEGCATDTCGFNSIPADAFKIEVVSFSTGDNKGMFKNLVAGNAECIDN